MPAAIAIPLLIGAAGTVAGSAISASAAKHAADTQAASGQQALGLQQQVYNNQLRAAQPYQQLGQQALGRLGAMPSQSFNPANYSHGVPMGAPPQMGAPQSQPAMPPGNAQAQIPAAGQNPQQMVTVQAPTGETRQFPLAQAQQIVAQSQGQAKILG